jgi:hypothetical protein
MGARERTIIKFDEGMKNHEGTGICVIFVCDVDILYHQYSGREIEFIGYIADCDYCSRDFRVRDNNGNMLIFSSPLINQQKLIKSENLVD